MLYCPVFSAVRSDAGLYVCNVHKNLTVIGQYRFNVTSTLYHSSLFSIQFPVENEKNSRWNSISNTSKGLLCYPTTQPFFLRLPKVGAHVYLRGDQRLKCLGRSPRSCNTEGAKKACDKQTNFPRVIVRLAGKCSWQSGLLSVLHGQIKFVVGSLL